MKLLLIAALLSTAATPTTAQPIQRRYFLPQTGVVQCPSGDSFRDIPLFDDTGLISMARVLDIADEPSLLARRTDGGAVVRFIWLRTFHAPVVIRLTMGKGAEAQVETVILSGHGGYDYGTVQKRARTTVPRSRADAVLAIARPAALKPVTPGCDLPGPPPGLDGARWLIERRDSNGHVLAERWSPHSGVVRDTGMALIRLAGLEGEKIY